MTENNWSQRILLNITTCPNFSYQYKIREADRMGERTVACFPEFVGIGERKKLYLALNHSKITTVPFVHIRDDFQSWELDYFWNQYQTRYFNVHEGSLVRLKSWPQKYWPHMYIEFNYNNRIPASLLVNLNKVGGFCLDFSHLWSARDRGVLEWEVINKLIKKYPVGCNHLNGYSHRRRYDLHYVRSINQLSYLREIPLKYFGHYLALEMNNSLASQQKYKNYIIGLLNKYSHS